MRLGCLVAFVKLECTRLSQKDFSPLNEVKRIIVKTMDFHSVRG